MIGREAVLGAHFVSGETFDLAIGHDEGGGFCVSGRSDGGEGAGEAGEEGFIVDAEGAPDAGVAGALENGVGGEGVVFVGVGGADEPEGFAIAGGEEAGLGVCFSRGDDVAGAGGGSDELGGGRTGGLFLGQQRGENEHHHERGQKSHE